MGYDLHITRAEDWCENAGFEITPEEWLDYVANDPELHILGENGDYFAEWGANDWLDWSEGNIYTKNPRSALIKKMVEIAEELDAVVQGDDGEVYSGDEEGYPED